MVLFFYGFSRSSFLRVSFVSSAIYAWNSAVYVCVCNVFGKFYFDFGCARIFGYWNKLTFKKSTHCVDIGHEKSMSNL